MRFAFPNITLCIEGAFRQGTQARVAQAIKGHGGRVSTVVNHDVNLLVVGRERRSADYKGPKERKAQAIGLPIIDEHQLNLLLGRGVLELGDEEAPEASLSEVIAQARSIFDGPTTPETWTRVVALVDACVTEQLDALVDYLEPQLAGRQLAPDERWVPEPGSRSAELASGYWQATTPRGELCVGPFHWLQEMMRGEASPKQRLIRALHTPDMRLDGRTLTRAISLETLTNLRVLSVGANPLSMTFWSTLLSEPNARGLEVLRIGTEQRDALWGIPGEHELDRLTYLALRFTDTLSPVLNAEVFERVEVLEVENVLTYLEPEELHGLSDPALLPSLDTLVLNTTPDQPERGASLELVLALPLADHDYTVRYFEHEREGEEAREIALMLLGIVGVLHRRACALSLTHEHTLTLGASFDPRDGSRTLADMKLAFAQALEELPKTPGLEVIRLGELYSEWVTFITVPGGVHVAR
jgi:hypothetical protein